MRLNIPKLVPQWEQSLPLLDIAFDRLTAIFLQLFPQNRNFINASSAAVSKYLPETPVVDYYYVKTDSSANAVIIYSASGHTINGATSFTLAAQYDSVLLVFDNGTQTWYTQ